MALETACGNGAKTKSIQADWRGEFRNQILEEELRSSGTILNETISHHSETNPVVERANRTIFTMNRTILAASGLFKGLWDHASAWSAYTKNRIPYKSLQGESPIHRMFHESDMTQQRNNLRVFGEKVASYNYITTDKLSP